MEISSVWPFYSVQLNAPASIGEHLEFFYSKGLNAFRKGKPKISIQTTPFLSAQCASTFVTFFVPGSQQMRCQNFYLFDFANLVAKFVSYQTLAAALQERTADHCIGPGIRTSLMETNKVSKFG